MLDEPPVAGAAMALGVADSAPTPRRAGPGKGQGFRVLGFRVVGLRVVGFRVWGFRVWGFRVWGLGFRGLGLV